MTEITSSLIDLRSISKPACKLIDLVGNAIGILHEPRRIRETARAEADAAVIHAEGLVQVEEVLSRARERRLNREFRQQVNLESIITLSIDELAEEVSEKAVDEDWVHLFVENCANVSDEQMQDLWARILAGEVESPGRFSKRFLEFMKCLSKREAMAIEEFYRYIWLVSTKDGLSAIYMNDELIQLNFQKTQPFVPYGLRIEMARLGLSHEGIAVTVDRGSRTDFTYFESQFFAENNGFLPTQLSVDCLTPLGMELLYICNPKPDEEYRDACVRQYKLVPCETPASKMSEGAS